jgi:hypothetical protein
MGEAAAITLGMPSVDAGLVETFATCTRRDGRGDDHVLGPAPQAAHPVQRSIAARKGWAKRRARTMFIEGAGHAGHPARRGLTASDPVARRRDREPR